MIKAAFCATLLLISGCATVSMVSQEAVVESGVSEQASALRISSDSFKQNAEARGWVEESRSLMDFANILFGGTSEQTDRQEASYAQAISASEAEVAGVFQAVASDATLATQELKALESLAVDVLSRGDVERRDLISFEGALVTAQKSYRSFAEAAGIAADRGTDGLDEAETALAGLATVIDAARGSADALADTYASRQSGDQASS